MVPAQAAREMIERLTAQPDTLSLSTVLADAYPSSGPELLQNRDLRRRVLERIATAPHSSEASALERFPMDEVAPVANLFVGKIKSQLRFSESFHWLQKHPKRLDLTALIDRIRVWRTMDPMQLSELIHLLHRYGPDEVLSELAMDNELYVAPGPNLGPSKAYDSQAEIALIGLAYRKTEETLGSSGFEKALLKVLDILLTSTTIHISVYHAIIDLLMRVWLPKNVETRLKLASLARQLAEHLMSLSGVTSRTLDNTIGSLNLWADKLESMRFNKSNNY